MYLYILIVILLVSIYLQETKEVEHFRSMTGLTYYRGGGRMPNRALRSIFNEYNVEKSSDSVIYIPKSYFGERDSQFKDLELKSNQLVLFVPGVYNVDEKRILWNNLVSFYGVEIASTLVPRSYDLDNNEDVQQFLLESNDNAYIAKTETEDAKGLLVSKDKTELYEKVKDNSSYSLLQKCIMDQTLIDNRSFKLRMFVLITCKNGIINIYLHDEGFIYYAKDRFDKENPTFNNMIANAWWYKDVKQSYLNNFMKNKPLTLEDFRKWFNLSNANNYDNLLARIRMLLVKIFDATQFKLCKLKKYDANMTISMCGIDILIDNNLNPWFIELNKKPGMASHGMKKVDEIKKTIWLDALDIGFNKKDTNNGFREIKTY